METDKAVNGENAAAADRSGSTRGPVDADAVRHFVERAALLFSDWGFPRMPARVLFALMTADEPGLTATQLAERLDVSPAAISGAVRYLGQLGFVVREAVPGSRRDRYRLRDRTWYAAVSTAVSFYDVLISAADDAIGPLGGPGTTAGGRVAEMRDFFGFVRGKLPAMLAEWQHSRQAVEGNGSGV